MDIERSNPDGMAPPKGYSHVVKTKDVVYIAGQVGLKPDGTLAGLDIESQADQVYQNLQVAHSSVGAGFADVHRINVFLTNREDWIAARAARDKYFGNTPPASTVVHIMGLPDPRFRIEVELTASVV